MMIMAYSFKFFKRLFGTCSMLRKITVCTVSKNDPCHEQKYRNYLNQCALGNISYRRCIYEWRKRILTQQNTTFSLCSFPFHVFSTPNSFLVLLLLSLRNRHVDLVGDLTSNFTMNCILFLLNSYNMYFFQTKQETFALCTNINSERAIRNDLFIMMAVKDARQKMGKL